MWIPVCYYLFFFYRDFKNKLIYATGFITGMLAIIVSFSRGGFVGVVACMATIWFFSKKKIMTILVLGVVGLVAFTFVGDSYWKEMSTVTDTHEKTADERLLSWGAAWRMFLDNPLGVGGNNFQYHFSEYQGAGFKKVMWGRMAHSLWFTLISETGIIGIYLYLTILYFNIKDILLIVNFKTNSENDDIKYINGLGCAFLASFAGYFASATFLSVLYYEHYWFMTGIIISTVTLFKRIENNQSSVA
jgi:O-antigen ligase